MSNMTVFDELKARGLLAQLTDEEEIKEGFYKEFGIKFDDFLLLDLPDTCGMERGRKENPEKYINSNNFVLNRKKANFASYRNNSLLNNSFLRVFYYFCAVKKLHNNTQ